jgi:hypothetical protein
MRGSGWQDRYYIERYRSVPGRGFQGIAEPRLGSEAAETPDPALFSQSGIMLIPPSVPSLVPDDDPKCLDFS